MNSKSISTSIIAAILVLSALSLAMPAHATSVPVSSVSLPAGSNALALTTDGQYLYYCSNSGANAGSIFKVSPTGPTLLATIANGGRAWASCYFYRQAIFAVDVSGGLWAYNLTTATLQTLTFDSPGGNNIQDSLGQMIVAGQCPIGDYNFSAGLCETWNSVTHIGTVVGQQKFWYSAYQCGLNACFYKTEYLKDVNPGNPAHYYAFPYTCATNSALCNLTGPFYAFASDPSGDAWFAAYGSKAVLEYVATANQMRLFTSAALSGFSSNSGFTGIAYSNGIVYVGLNSTGIGELTVATNATATVPTLGSYPFGLAVSGTNIFWTSSGSDHKICQLLVATCANTGERNYYPLPLANGNIAYGFIGSGGVGIAGFGAISTTTTTTSTTTSTTSTSTTSSSTSTSISTNECGGLIGGLCNYAAQRVPVITVNSTGLAGQHNVYLTHNGSVTITGFQWFMLGGSGGTFKDLGLCDTAVSCAGFAQVQSPSRGTFQSLTWTTPPTVEGPQPACSLVPYLSFCHLAYAPINIVQSQTTRVGILCNDAYVVNTVSQCSGNGVPVSYQAFRIAINNLPSGETTVVLQAVGTDSQGQASINNILVYDVAA